MPDTLSRGAALGLLAEAMVLPTGIISAAILTRSLGLSDYGLVGVVMAASGPVAWLLASIMGLRSGVRIISGAADPLAAASAVLRLNAAIGLAGALVFVLAAPLVARMLGHPEITTALRLAAAEVVLLPITRAHRDALAATGNYSASGLSGGVFHLVRLAFVVALIAAGFWIETVMIAVAAGRVAEILWCRLHLAVPLHLRFDLAGAGLLAMLGPTFVYALCNRVAGSLDILMLSASGARDGAISHYAAAQMLAQIPGLFGAVLVPGLISALTRAQADGDRALVAGLLDDMARLVAVVTALLLVGAGSSASVLRVLFGPQFAGAAPILALLLAGGGGTILLAVSTAQMLAFGRNRTPAVIAVPMLAAIGVGLWVVIPRFGATGAAAVTGGVMLAAGFSAVILLQGDRTARLWLLIRAGAAGAAGGIAAYALMGQVPPLVDALVGTLITTGLLMAGGVMSRALIARFLAAATGSRVTPGGAGMNAVPRGDRREGGR